MTSTKSPDPPSIRPSLFEGEPSPSSSFSDTLVDLGFAQAKSQKFEWLTSFPTARPLLRAIQTHFTPECVLTSEQAIQYASLRQNLPVLPDSELLEAAKLLVPPALSYPDITQQRRQHLDRARKRLSLLRVQRDLLREELSLQRPYRRTQNSCSPSAQTRKNSDAHCIQHLQEGLDHLRTCLRLNPCSLNMDTSIDMYCQKERHLFDEMLTFAAQNFQIQRPAKSYGPTTPGALSLRQVVKSYSEIKGQHCIQEARLLRANAMLASLNLHMHSPRKQHPSASLHALIKDLRAKGMSALNTKVKAVTERSEEQLWERIQTVLLTETLRRQNHIIETARFFAKICLEQRVRILCFYLATSAQEDRYRQLYDVLHRLAATARRDSTLQATNAQGNLSVTPVDFTEMYRPLWSVMGTLDHVKQLSEIEAFEGEIFNSGIQCLSERLAQFIHKIGWDGSWLRLDSHPKYNAMVKELEGLLNHNTAILEAVLRKRESQTNTAAHSRDWIDAVNLRA